MQEDSIDKYFVRFNTAVAVQCLNLGFAQLRNGSLGLRQLSFGVDRPGQSLHPGLDTSAGGYCGRNNLDFTFKSYNNRLCCEHTLRCSTNTTCAVKAANEAFCSSY
jgi:hypothetical protein